MTMNYSSQIVKEITEAVANAIKNLYDIESVEIFVEHPSNEEFGDYATPVALRLAKELKQSPLEIAKDLCYELDNKLASEIFSKVSFAAPGFINFTLSSEYLYSLVNEINTATSSYGAYDFGAKKRVALEHSNVNPNKAAHVGHLRNACIGQFLERVYENLGFAVDVQYLDNDLGVQVTTSLMGVEMLTHIKSDDYAKYDHYAWDIYAAMESLIAEKPELQKERQRLMAQLEAADSEISQKQVALSEKILVEQLKTFAELGFDYDVVIRERDIVTLKLWETAFERLKQNENVYYAEEGTSKGCWLVKMGNNTTQQEDKIIVRANGVPTYTGKDIAYHMWKFNLLNKDFYYRNFAINTQEKKLWITSSDEKTAKQDITFAGSDMVLNVVDVKQTYALEAVRLALKYLGYAAEATNMIHVNYGFVYLSRNTAEKLGIDVSDGASQYGMSGRKGWGIKIDDFVQLVDARLAQDFGTFEALNDIRNGAIKFEMLKHNTFQDLVFDLEESLNLQGYSGPYIQYTYARAMSVLAKATTDVNVDVYMYNADQLVTNLEEKELAILRHLAKYPDYVLQSAQEFSPNLLCTYLFELSQRFNTFYNDISILKADTEVQRNFRLYLTRAVGQVVQNGLFLLGITAPDKI